MKDTIETIITRLKRIHELNSLVSNSIVIGEGIGYLKPLCDLHVSDDKLIEILTKWRKNNMHIFPLSFQVSNDSMRRWISEKLLKTENRILFLVVDQHDHLIGHIGLTYIPTDREHFEIENVIRGDERCLGLMGNALTTLMRWASDHSACSLFCLSVLNDNPHALRFYENNGFSRVGIRMLDGMVAAYQQFDSALETKHFILMERIFSLQDKNGMSEKISSADRRIGAE